MKWVKYFKHLQVLIRVKHVVMWMRQVSFKTKYNANIVQLHAFILKKVWQWEIQELRFLQEDLGKRPDLNKMEQ